MKVIIFIRNSDNYVKVGRVLPRTLSALTGSGGMIAESNIEREIAKHLIQNATDEVSFATNWSSFLTSKKGTEREVQSRKFVEGMARGGLTEDQAFAVMADFTIPDDCTSYQIAEDTEIPTDRYFRNSWEWS
jgi:hypothetical protein